MADKVTPATRSRIMSRIKAKDTTPELIVRSYLHRHGFRFRLHRKDLPGKPDLTLTKYRTVVFVNGCFWHQHPDGNCPSSGIPISNQTYWKPKLERTVKRDLRAREALELAGWHVETVWECEISEKRLQELCETITAQIPVEA